MRSLFNGYYRPATKDFKELWSRGTFVFDTNVLLTSYLLPQTSRDVFHSILTQLGPRVWIPYHVALEFQRNRVSRIKDSGRNLEGAEKLLGSARALPELIQAAELDKRGVSEPGLAEALEAYSTILERIATALIKARQQLPSLSLEDAIRDHLSEVFKDRIGAPPQDQAALNKLIFDADQRYQCEVPPGYRDAAKSSAMKFMDRGIYYEPKHGDLIIWKQVLDHIRSAQLKSVVFVTEDKKEDWWCIERGKTLGPRPELIQEALQSMEDSGGLFWIYSLEQFLQFAGEYLNTTVVPQEAIQQARDVSATYSVSDAPDTRHPTFRDRILPTHQATDAVIEWIVQAYNPTDIEQRVSLSRHETEEIIVKLGSDIWLLHVLVTEESAQGLHQKITALSRVSREDSPTFHTVVLVISGGDAARVELMSRAASSYLRRAGQDAVSILIGTVTDRHFRIENAFGALPIF